MSSIFRFKAFDIHQENSALKIGADAMLLGSFVNAHGARTAIDIGAGTGVLSLMLAQQYPNLQIDAVEIDEMSFTDCVKNFNQSNWTDRLNARCMDVLQWNPAKKYELIVSNPPFYTNSLINADERIARTKHAAFLPLKELVSWMCEALHDNGVCWVIWPYASRNEYLEQIDLYGLHLTAEIIINSKPNKPSRVIYAFAKKSAIVNSTEFTIRDEKGNYTDAYIERTKHFHSVDLSLLTRKN